MKLQYCAVWNILLYINTIYERVEKYIATVIVYDHTTLIGLF